MQWIIDSSPHKGTWTSKRVIQETLALWFGSVHQLAMVSRLLYFKRQSELTLVSGLQSFTYALYDLCEYPECIVPLREEIERARLEDFSAWQPENMPRLDSFLKESARLNPSDASEYKAARMPPFFIPVELN